MSPARAGRRPCLGRSVTTTRMVSQTNPSVPIPSGSSAPVNAGKGAARCSHVRLAPRPVRSTPKPVGRSPLVGSLPCPASGRFGLSCLPWCPPQQWRCWDVTQTIVTRENTSKTLEIVPEAPRKPKARTIRQVHRRLRPDEIEYLADGYRSGLTVYELSDRFRIDRRTVALVLKRSEVPLRHQPLSQPRSSKRSRSTRADCPS